MNIIRSAHQMQQMARAVRRSNRRVALVPTMGALHAGHVALIRAARDQGAAVAVSLFVNPTQFGPNEDFKNYPRDFAADEALCRREGVDVLFAPEAKEIYLEGASVWVTESQLSKRLEGERRPGFFRGVCTVVTKLCHIVDPDVAVFGQKDYQQLKVIQRLVRDLLLPVEIVPVPTVREEDGLACSSRNQYLNSTERAQATVLFKALSIAQDLFEKGERNAHRLEAAMMRTIEIAPAARVDYVDVVDPETLESRHESKRGDVAMVAAYIDKTRLIDNLVL